MLRLYIHGLSPGLFSIMQNLLEDVDETVECFQSVFCTFIYSGVLEYLAEDFSYFLLQDMFDVVRVDIRIIWKELVYPVRMFFNLFVAADIFPFRSSISPLRRAGSTASPMTSIRPIFSFLI